MSLRKHVVIVVLAGVCAAILFTRVHAQSVDGAPITLDSARRLADTVETLEAGGDPAGAGPLPEQVGAAYALVAARVAANPDDVPASILLARLGRILRTSMPVELTATGARESGAPPVEASITALSHALELEPNNAEAHYWLARTYGVAEPKMVDGRLSNEPLGLEEAITHVRQAVAAAPGEPRYREALAIYLSQARRYAEAIAALRGAGAGNHLIARILTDLDAVPLPAEAVYLPDESANIAETMAGAGRFENYAELRVRAYVAPSSKAVFEEALRRRWPSFEFHEAEREDSNGTRTTTFAQALRQFKDGLQPLPRKEIATLVREIREPDEPVMVTAMEFLNPPREALERYGVRDTEHLTLLVLVAGRKADINRVGLTPLGNRLLGEWTIKDWSYQGARGRETYAGTLRVTAQVSEPEFEGVLFSRSQSGNWARQRMRIVAKGNRLEATGRVVAAGETWSPDDLSLTLSGDRLQGRSIDASGEGGKVVFERAR